MGKKPKYISLQFSHHVHVFKVQQRLKFLSILVKMVQVFKRQCTQANLVFPQAGPLKIGLWCAILSVVSTAPKGNDTMMHRIQKLKAGIR